MEMVGLVILLALLEYIVFSMLVGRARMTYKVEAPAMTGDPIFERYYRVQQNTLEQLAVFIPAIAIYGYFGNPTWAAAIGVLFLVGRPVYLLGYVKDPAKRGLGFMIGFLSSIVLWIAGLTSIISNLI